MIALTFLDLEWFAINALQWAGLAAIVLGALLLVHAFAAVQRDSQRTDTPFDNPSNVTVVPYTRPFNFEEDA